MRFVDEAVVHVRAGKGGAGAVAFLREKYRPKGGPAGGDGGKGGDVVFVADGSLTTLLDFKFEPRHFARNGENGRGKDQHGKAGDDLRVRVPAGTRIVDAETGELIADLTTANDEAIVAHGGKGGRGNARYATSTNQAPRYAQPGLPGEERMLRLELHLLADVGLVGYPNVGKSSLIRVVSAARPRVADYPFTTLVPHLGVVRVDEADFVLADIPGLIEGAHRGHGLGTRFLRHLSRTRLLIHLLDVSGLTGRDPVEDYDRINRELELFDPELARKPQIVAANKIDLAEARQALPEVRARLAERGIELEAVSTVTREGVAELLRKVASRLERLPAAATSGGGEDERARPPHHS
jgi:GTP-binding protein